MGTMAGPREGPRVNHPRPPFRRRRPRGWSPRLPWHGNTRRRCAFACDCSRISRRGNKADVDGDVAGALLRATAAKLAVGVSQPSRDADVGGVGDYVVDV